MNCNNSLKQRIIWHKPPNLDAPIATFTDDGTLPIFELQDTLSLQEKAQASTLNDSIEQRHYIMRRCFQRLYVSELLGSTIAPEKLALVHQRDTRPYCADAPHLNLSFSTSGTTAIACASAQHALGIDIERLRRVENAISLAKRFFTAEEAEALAILPEEKQSLAFLHYWTAKEAGLKAIGKGIVSGLNTFRLRDKGNFSYDILGPPDIAQKWNLEYLEIAPQHLVALVNINNSR